jgi:hypothetical protein
MAKPTQIPPKVVATDFLRATLNALTIPAVEALLAQLPTTDVNGYHYDDDNPEKGWIEGNYHWMPVGRDRGNAGRIRLAGKPIYPLAERLVNGMEALIELKRLRELKQNSTASVPNSPREAVARYFGLPPLDQIPKSTAKIDGKPIRAYALELSRQLLLKLDFDKKRREFAVLIRDHGMGQTGAKMHKSLLSLGSSDKGDKPYLIGVFGQGGSSTYMASKCSWIVTRRAPDILAPGETDEIGWSVVRHIIPKGRRDPYFAYLAAHPDGRVPTLPAAAADALDFKHGSQFCHVGYDFGPFASAITRTMFQALNHVLYNPVLPFYTNIAGTTAPVSGNGYRLSDRKIKEPEILDKPFESRPIEIE